MRRKIIFCLAWLCIGAGVLGIFLPLLPTTPFLLAAAFCFAKSSPRFYRWLISNQYLNSYLENYRSGCGVPGGIIFRSLLFLWCALMFSAFLWSNVWYWSGLAVIGIAVSVHLLCMKRTSEWTRKNFSLLELLVSMGVIALLSSMLFPVLSMGRNMAKGTVCMANLKQIGLALHAYAGDFNDRIPDTFNGYTSGSIPIIKMYGGIPYALGKLLPDYRLRPATFGCPLNPSRNKKYVETAWNGGGVVQTAYLYRETDADFQECLGAEGNKDKALIMDFSCISSTGAPIIPHEFKNVNIFYAAGHVLNRTNSSHINQFFTIFTPVVSAGIPPCETIWRHADTP